jgi:hypothetical protein
MEFSFAFLASSADHLMDGRMLVVGPDIETLLCSQFPATATIALAMKLAFDPEEVGKPHTLAVEYTKPGGTLAKIMGQTPIGLKPNPEDPNLKAFASIIANLTITFESAGIYQFHLAIDDQEIKSLSLTAKLHDFSPGIS